MFHAAIQKIKVAHFWDMVYYYFIDKT